MGDPHHIDSLFQLLGDAAIARYAPDRASITCPTLPECDSVDVVVEEVARLLQYVNAFAQIYVGGHIDLRIFRLEEDRPGRTTRVMAFTNPFDIIVRSQHGLELLCHQDNNGVTRCARLISDARGRADVSLVLGCFSQSVIGWRDIYDVIEGVGGVDKICREIKAPKAKLELIKRTANHYRHLGAKNDYPLPANPPDLHTARTIVTRIVQLWLSLRLPTAPRADEVLTSPSVSDRTVIAATHGGEPIPDK